LPAGALTLLGGRLTLPTRGLFGFIVLGGTSLGGFADAEGTLSLGGWGAVRPAAETENTTAMAD